MIDQVLNLELRVLLYRYGRRRVLESLAALGEQSLPDLEAQMSALEKRSKEKGRRPPKTAQELVAAACKDRPESEGVVLDLINRYENRLFLPQLRDVERFLNHRGIRHTRLKSRTDALPRVVQGLSQLSPAELKRLLEGTSQEGQTDFALLADQIMGGRKTKPES